MKKQVIYFFYAVALLSSKLAHGYQHEQKLGLNNYEVFAEEAINDLIINSKTEKLNELHDFIYINQVKVTDEVTRGLITLSSGYVQLQKYGNSNARDLFIEAYNIFDSVDNMKYKGFASGCIAITHINDGELEKAIEFGDKAIALLEETEFKDGYFDLNFSMQGVYSKLNQYDKSIEYGLRAIKINDELGKPNVSLKYLYADLAQCYLEKNDFNNADFYLVKARKECKEEHKFGRIKVYQIYANFYAKKNNYKFSSTYKDSLIVIYFDASKEDLKVIDSLNVEQKALNATLLTKKTNQINNTRLFIYALAFLLFSLLFSFVRVFKLNKQLRLDKQVIDGLLKENQRNLMSKIFNISTKNDLLVSIANKLKDLLVSDNTLKKPLMPLIKEITRNANKSEVWDEFQIHFEKTNPNFFKRLREINISVTPKDLRLSAYIVANLNSKEIASLVGTSVRSVETAKYRLKKKLDLDTDTNLIDFLMSL